MLAIILNIVLHVLQKQKAQESEAACSRIDSLHKKEQAENARLKARLSSDEKQVHDVLQQISQVRHMHNSLLQTLGEANKHLHEGKVRCARVIGSILPLLSELLSMHASVFEMSPSSCSGCQPTCEVLTISYCLCVQLRNSGMTSVWLLMSASGCVR